MRSRQIQDLLGGINETLGTAFSLLVSLSIPTSFQEVIQCLLGPLSAGFNFNGCDALRGLIGGRFQMMRPKTSPPPWTNSGTPSPR